MDDKLFCYVHSTSLLYCCLIVWALVTYRFMLLNFVQIVTSFCFGYHLILHMHCSLRIEDFSEHLSPILWKSSKIFYSVSRCFFQKRTFSRIFTKAFEQTCHADLIKGSIRVSGIWPIKQVNLDHNLFTSGKIYIEAPQDNQANEIQVTQVLFSVLASTGACLNIGEWSILETVENDSIFGSLVGDSKASSRHAIGKLPDF